MELPLLVVFKARGPKGWTLKMAQWGLQLCTQGTMQRGDETSIPKQPPFHENSYGKLEQYVQRGSLFKAISDNIFLGYGKYFVDNSAAWRMLAAQASLLDEAGM